MRLLTVYETSKQNRRDEYVVDINTVEAIHV